MEEVGIKNERISHLKSLLSKWGIDDIDLELLDQALTHPSFAFENQERGIIHNQRLEFLGDAVLGVVTAEYLYHTYPLYSEGNLTKIRAAAVCELTLSEIAQKMDLGQYLKLGKGEELSGGRKKPSILADALEAVIGAVYLTGGWEKVRYLILKYLKDYLKQTPENHLGDYKTAFQELVQREGRESIFYRILKEYGPDHDKKFIAGVFYKGQVMGQGEGRTKKEAEQKAAKAAMQNWKLSNG